MSVGSIGQRIEALKRDRNAVILAHYYQDPDIQDIADFLGDSLALARYAQTTSADTIVLCGVHFMAETAKILNPVKTVLVPDLKAGCSLADSCEPSRFLRWKHEHPGHVVVSYINTFAAIKAMSDYVCTSSNAVAIVQSISPDQPILFAPDVNLGRYVQKQTGRSNMVLWPGTCVVHETFYERYLLKLLAEYPDAVVIAHPECDASVLRYATYIGSTQALLKYTQSHCETCFIVATEVGILHAMQKASPHKTFIPAAPAQKGQDVTCGCSTCPYMKLNTLEKIEACLRTMSPCVELDESLRLQALTPLERMVSF